MCKCLRFQKKLSTFYSTAKHHGKTLTFFICGKNINTSVLFIERVSMCSKYQNRNKLIAIESMAKRVSILRELQWYNFDPWFQSKKQSNKNVNKYEKKYFIFIDVIIASTKNLFETFSQIFKAYNISIINTQWCIWAWMYKYVWCPRPRSLNFESGFENQYLSVCWNFVEKNLKLTE